MKIASLTTASFAPEPARPSSATHATASESAQRISASILRARVRDIFTKRQLDMRDALSVADVLVETSLRGVNTHGVRLAPKYARLLDLGKAKASPRLAFKDVDRSVMHLDADGALGPVAGMAATARSLELAHDNGVGAVAVERSNHFGSAGHYAIDLARRGGVGIVLSNANALVAPHAVNDGGFKREGQRAIVLVEELRHNRDDIGRSVRYGG